MSKEWDMAFAMGTLFAMLFMLGYLFGFVTGLLAKTNSVLIVFISLGISAIVSSAVFLLWVKTFVGKT